MTARIAFAVALAAPLTFASVHRSRPGARKPAAAKAD